MPVIELSAISKHYAMGQQLIKAVDSLDLTLDYNEYVVFIGSSGSGKSTLMNIIGCLDTPTAGSYCSTASDVSGMNENELADIRNQEIGFVFQSFNLLPRATALENVMQPLIYAAWASRAQGRGRARARARRPRGSRRPPAEPALRRPAAARRHRARARQTRRSCSPTSRPATSTRRPSVESSRSSTSCTTTGKRSCSSRTSPTSRARRACGAAEGRQDLRGLRQDRPPMH